MAMAAHFSQFTKIIELYTWNVWVLFILWYVNYTSEEMFNDFLT